MSEDIENQENQEKQKKFIESNAGDGTTVYDQHLHGIPLYLTFGACLVTLFLIGLDQTIVFTILVDVGTKFNAYDKIGWIASAYMLTLAVFAATWGKASIIFGRKPTVLLAILLFEVGSLICAVANNINTLIGGRILAGIGGGGIQNVVFIIVTESVPISKRPLVFAILGVAFASSSVAGPLIGGAFTEHVTWRWCFYINLPLGGVAALALLLVFHPPKTKGTWKSKFLSLDYIGVSLLSIGLVLFLLGLTFGGQEFPWQSGAVISLFILGGLILIAFGVWNFKYSKSPIIPLNLIKSWKVMIPNTVVFLSFFNFMGLSIYFTTYFQIIKGASAFKTGVHLLPLIIPLIISSIGTGILMRKTRYIKPYAVVAAVFAAVGSGTLTLWEVDSPPRNQIGLLILPGLSIGCLLQTTMMAVQLSAPKTEGSTILATTLLNFSRAIGGAIGADLSQVIFNSSVKNILTDQVNANPDIFGEISSSNVSHLVNSPDLIQALNPEAKSIVLNSIMRSIRNVFYTSASLCSVMFIIVLFFPNNRIPADNQVLTKEEYEKQNATVVEKDDADENNIVESKNENEDETNSDNLSTTK